jgi:hypothetical protein
MKTKDEAAAYDKWFHAQVQEAIDNPRPSIPHAEVKERMAKFRAELLKKKQSD